jgi:predicted ATPase
VVERDAAEAAINAWNHERSGNADAPILLPVRWESDVSFTYGLRLQQQINQWIVDTAEIGIVIFWNRMGQGNTKLELERLHERGAAVLVFVCERISEEPRSDELTSYLKSIEHLVYAYKYSDAAQLHDLILAQLRRLVPTIPLRHPALGTWIELKDSGEESGRPYSVLKISSKPNGTLTIDGTSYASDGIAGVNWTNRVNQVLEGPEGKLFQFYITDHKGDVVTGSSEYDFVRLVGHYYQVTGTAKRKGNRTQLPDFKVSFKLLPLTPQLASFVLSRPIDALSSSDRDNGHIIERLHQLRMHPRIIITGGSHAGKSSLVRYLHDTYSTEYVSEAAEAVVQSWRAKYGDDFFNQRLKRMPEFQSDILDLQIANEAAIHSALKCTPVVLDRSGADGIVYLELNNNAVPRSLITYTEEQRRFTACVFVLDTLADFRDRREEGRESNRANSVLTGQQLQKLYQKYGYRVVRLREYSRDEMENTISRAKFVIEEVEKARDRILF